MILQIFKLLLKWVAYIVFGYIPLLIVCVVVSVHVVFWIVDSLDVQCYGGMDCLGNGVAILMGGIGWGILVSLIIVIYLVARHDAKKRKSKHKPKRMNGE